MLEISTKQKLCVFSLIRTKKECYYPPVIADYTPLNNHPKGDYKLNQAAQQIIPAFNLDYQFFTPAFINPYQQTLLKQSSDKVRERQLEKFMRKITASQQSAVNEINHFSPTLNNYCSLCRTIFQCYWKHINDQAHRKRIKSNKFNTYIKDLCTKLNRSNTLNKQNRQQISKPLNKKKKIQKPIKKQTKIKQQQIFNREDFIIKLPIDLFSKQGQHINYNISTNGFNSLDNVLKQ